MRQRFARVWGLVLAVQLLVIGGRAVAEAPGKDTGRQTGGKALSGKDAARAAELRGRIDRLFQAGDFAAAVAPAKELRELGERLQGKDHWQTVDARFDEETARKFAGRSVEEQRTLAASYVDNRQGVQLNNKRQYRAAAPLLEKALATRRRLLGEEHPTTAQSYNNLAYNLDARGKNAAAEESYRKALALRQKLLGEQHPATAASYNNLASSLAARGRNAEAEGSYRKALALYEQLLGEEHLDTANGYLSLARTLNAQGKYAEAELNYRKGLALDRKLLGEEHPATGASYSNLAHNLSAQGRYAEAEQIYRTTLALVKKLWGEEHPATATNYSNLAYSLMAQGKYAEAEQDFRKALALDRKLLGEEHFSTASDCRSLAHILLAQGKYAEAERDCRKALGLCRKTLGEEHRHTAVFYSSLASILMARGNFAEAEEIDRKVLALERKVLGDLHPDTATGYLSLAHVLNRQGKHAEAEERCRKALALHQKLLGEEHPHTANTRNTLAAILNDQGKYAEAEQYLRKALALRQKLLGREHPDLVQSYNNLAVNLIAQGKCGEAEEYSRKTLTLYQKLWGPEHPLVATAYGNLAGALAAQKKPAEAEAAFRKALALRQKLLGEEHPDTATSYNYLASIMNAQGKYAEAEQQWIKAAASFREARLRFAHAGLDRAARTGEASPLPALAAVLARNGKPGEAWQRFEQSLAPSTLDDLAARRKRSAADQQRLDQLLVSLERLDRQIAAASARPKSSAEAEKQRASLLTRQRQTLDELAALHRELEKKGGMAEGVSLSLAQIQKALPPDAALIGWLDRQASPHARDSDGEHWGLVLRRSGDPIWVRLPGLGTGGRWTPQDDALRRALRQALASPTGDWQPLARKMRQQRLEPLAKYLQASGGLPAVQRLFVLPSVFLAGIPVELLAEGRTVSYTPSGTILAHLRGLPRLATTGLLALADPIFDRPKPAAEPPLPSHGLLVTFVTPRSNGARAGLRPGDVLLSYDGTELRRREDLKPRPEGTDADARVDVRIWRAGKSLRGRLRPGKLGVILADDPAPIALAESRRRDRHLLAASRGGDDVLAELPGTRVEAAWLARLFEARHQRVTLLLDSDASEQKLHALAEAGELKKYRYLHLATHGEMNDRFSLQSALRLSRDALPDPAQQLAAGKPLFDSRLTAAEVLRDWKLDADLVTLSACQSGLGKYEWGEGYVGFAQALLLAGARSVCLSLWKVDDGATALLMGRFYQNLLGQRAGLQGPLGKAEALAEAKQWLRTLSRTEALKLAGRYSGGVERGKGRKQGPLLPPLPAATQATDRDRPYAHPYYWAAFVLLGDPE